MKLNRTNYEEYFILYLDNELGSEDRLEVEAFAKNNPDLSAELDMLLQSKLSPDTDLTFINKEVLLVRDSSSISLNNYEQWLLSYIDDELTVAERKDVEQFVAGNPSVQKEMGLFQQIKLQPEAIVFPYKDSLYREEEKVRVVPIRWWRLAAAAVLLAGLITTAVVVLKNKKVDQPGEIAKEQPKEQKSIENTPVVQPRNATASNPEQLAVNDKDPKQTKLPVKNNSSAIAANQKNIHSKEKKERQEPVQEKETAVAKENFEKKPSNNLPQPEHNPNVNAIAKNDANNTKSNTVKEISPELTNTIPYQDKDAVTVSNLQPSNFPDESGDKKNKHRGFFRKITRTFEKRTNIKATDGDDEGRLLIAGLSIKLN